MSLEENRKKFQQNALYVPQPPFPPRILIEASNACNHACVFCAHEQMQRKPVHIDVDFARQLLENAYALGARECSFHGGGEAFLHQRLADIVGIAKKTGYTFIYLTTNGTACSWERMEEVLEAGLDSLKFSINAGTPEDYKKVHGKDDFDKVYTMVQQVHTWRQSQNKKFPLYISSIVYAGNAKNIRQLSSLYSALVDEIAYIDAYWHGCKTAVPREELLPHPRKNICTEPFGRITVGSDGMARVCCSDGENFSALADAKTTTLQDIWQSPLFNRIRQAILENSLPENTLCYNCLHYADTPLRPFAEMLN